MDEEAHAKDGIDVANVIAEEDASERGKCAHEIGFEGDGCFNPRKVRGCCETARHDDVVQEDGVLVWIGL